MYLFHAILVFFFPLGKCCMTKGDFRWHSWNLNEPLRNKIHLGLQKKGQQTRLLVVFHPYLLSFVFMQTTHMRLPHLDTTSSEQGQLHFLHFRCKNNHRFPPVLNCCLRFTMPNYARFRKQVRHCSVPGTQSYRAGLNKQAFHCCLYLTILIMCVFGNRRCLVIEKYCPYTFFFPHVRHD